MEESVSAVYYPIKIVEIVNSVLSPIYPLSEWGFVFFSGLYLPPEKKKSRPQPGPPIKTGLEPPLGLCIEQVNLFNFG